MDIKIKDLINNFNQRNINTFYFATLDDAKEKILELIPVKSTVGIGNSQTLKKMDISQAILNRGNIVYDKTLAKTKEESKLLKRKSLITDWYLTSSNAISKEGHLVNIDHSGNRVAAMIYGPEKVIIVAGRNKIVDNLEQAKDRVRNYAARLNAKRAGLNPPCITTKKCVDCRSVDRVCNNYVVIEGQYEKDRMKLFIVDEDLG